MKVWIWYTGEYDSRDIEGVFSSEAAAHAAYDAWAAELKAARRGSWRGNMAESPAPPYRDIEEHEVKS